MKIPQSLHMAGAIVRMLVVSTSNLLKNNVWWIFDIGKDVAEVAHTHSRRAFKQISTKLSDGPMDKTQEARFRNQCHLDKVYVHCGL